MGSDASEWNEVYMGYGMGCQADAELCINKQSAQLWQRSRAEHSELEECEILLGAGENKNAYAYVTEKYVFLLM